MDRKDKLFVINEVILDSNSSKIKYFGTLKIVDLNNKSVIQ